MGKDNIIATIILFKIIKISVDIHIYLWGLYIMYMIMQHKVHIDYEVSKNFYGIPSTYQVMGFKMCIK